jgi:hypothetical protein
MLRSVSRFDPISAASNRQVAAQQPRARLSSESQSVVQWIRLDIHNLVAEQQAGMYRIEPHRPDRCALKCDGANLAIFNSSIR